MQYGVGNVMVLHYVTMMVDVYGGNYIMHYLVIDPGVSTGLAAFNSNGQIIRKWIIRGLDNFADWLEALAESDRPKVIIYEGYTVYSKKANAHIGSKVETAQVIGMIKAKARLWGCEIHEQPASILSIAQLWAGVKMPSNHDKSHDVSAYLHGVYYLQKNGVRKSRLLS